MQPDTDVPENQGVQAWDRFAYVNNAPTTGLDPTGHREECPEDENCDGTLQSDNTVVCPGEVNCDGSSQGDNNDVIATLNTLATVTQDIATLIDLVFATPEVVIGTIGVMSGGPETLPLTVGGMDFIFNIYGGNLAETIFSGISLGFTAVADIMEDGQFGDTTLTSASTFGAGLGMPDPIGDLAIDGYASGYNHGIFSGITDILSGAPLFDFWP